jgi:GT2 family glycosyltransferase
VAAPHATVVVPTRARPVELARCLDALHAQDAPFAWEVVVVNDAPSPLSLPAEHEARVVENGGRGPASARNAGAREAAAALVCLIDDDCVAEPAWLRTIVARAEREHGAVVAGRTVNGLPDDPLAEASQQIVGWLQDVTRRSDAEAPFAPTSNVCCPRETLLAVPFDPAFPDAAAEDRDWCARLAEAGIRLVTEDDAVVLHRAPVGLREFVRRHARYGAGAASYRDAHAARARTHPPAAYAQLVRRSFAEGPAVGAAVLLAQAVTVAGYATARLRRVVATRREPRRDHTE